MDTSDFEKKYNEHKEYFKKLLAKLKKEKKKVLFKNTNIVQLDLAERIGFIYEGILDAAKDDNLYVCFILYRAMIEHFFKLFYLFEEMGTNHDDSVAEKYLKHYLISEFMAEQAGILEMEDIQNDNQVKTDFLTFINNMPEFKGYDKSNQQEISAAIKQFGLKEIIRYLNKKHEQKDKLKQAAEFWPQIIPEYALVSTFTHGGAYASALMEKFKKEKQIENQLTKVLKLGLTMAGSSRENVFMTYKLETSFMGSLLEMHSLRKYST